jgi:pimeloyl-ACP methyl ester carboxylesterase
LGAVSRRASRLALSALVVATPLHAQAPALFYEVDGGGPSIVFLADWAQDTSIWFRLLPELRGEFRLIRYDLRGQGRSEAASDDDYSIVAHREDLERLLDELGIERAHLVGAGLGGAIALSFAVARPDRVESVAAIHPHVSWSSGERTWWARFLESYDRAGRPPLADYTSVLVERWFGARYPDREPWIVSFCDLMLRRQASEPLIASLRAWLGTGLSMEGEATVPALVLWGERQRPTAEEARIWSAFSRMRREIVADAGAVPQVEAPSAVAELLREFFGDVEGVSSPQRFIGGIAHAPGP